MSPIQSAEHGPSIQAEYTKPLHIRPGGANEVFFFTSGDTNQVDIYGSLASTEGVYIGTTSTNNLIYDATNGSGSATLYIGNRTIDTSVSDARKKDVLGPASRGLEELLGLNVVDFTWKPDFDDDSTTIYTGMLAQEVYQAMPDLVRVPEDEETGLWAVKYNNMVPLLVKAIQEQQELIEQVLNVPATAITDPLPAIDSPDLDIQALVVRQAATFYGTLYVKGEVGFEHKVVFNEDIEVKGKIYASADQAGTATIPATATSTEIVFGSEYEVVPKVTATAGQPLPLGISSQTTNGFRVFIAQPQTTDISFDWIALAVKSEGEPPVINNLISSLDFVEFDTAVSLTASASDPDTTAGTLTYSWSTTANLGFFAGIGNSVFWTIAESEVSDETEVTITVTVSDGSNSVSQSRVVTVVIPEDPSLPPGTGEEPEEPNIVLGCTDELALNYDPEATEDDEGCLYEETPVVILGCIDETALNYNPEAIEDDESCEYELLVILGCMDELALNYDPEATEDDDTCEYEPIVVAGCVDETALNYNFEATEDDGSCEYEEVVIEEPTSTTTEPLAQGDNGIGGPE